MNIRRATAAVALAGATALALTLTGCSGTSASAKDGKLDVVASFYPLEYATEQIGGAHVHVTDLTPPGTEPHDLELAPRQVAAVHSADLVVYLKGLQPTVDQAVAQGGPAHTAEVTSYAPLEDHGTEVDGAAENHARTADGRAGDPHVWLDPERYAKIARGIGDQLAKADPAHAADYRAGADRFTARLGALDKEFRTGLTGCRAKTFVTSHAAFGYLAESYGLDQIAINGVDPESEPTPARMTEIQDQAREHGVTTVFFESLVSPKLARTIAGDLHLKTAVLDPLEGVKDPAKDDYFSVMRRNLANLRTALGCSR
ncbi:MULTISPECIES: metal ABC transporter substrate-binding protein [Streptomycetaceae]|uniref:Putative metal transport ABC transporter substrate-binding protein n=1 Tax=Streptantibioticus cattleyicolor (strain ATCC 35852 / DSM 46488 / JCM 4925 / NBRC 14057 / NRRL 8057) TaxID=1003195 RepID=F8JP03_STREN|nr:MULTISPECIES: metal ABC transporter substrate-binding protein [Streptomycetaceae]AEW93944.1 putative metal transport ABC transporter substrate-binding protein [Streptantibioticus cattleyicolor NRRL 8057 = DSM 46488]MYS58620.1 zinc ABC transporter solute-binding protein [Streptomyces sp. SID5468]CCB74290.1 ABC-transporter metal-binding lipoprotein [Streptantibioticus cattleyicolor NRRL 8057 = DSM 46488]